MLVTDSWKACGSLGTLLFLSFLKKDINFTLGSPSTPLSNFLKLQGLT